MNNFAEHENIVAGLYNLPFSVKDSIFGLNVISWDKASGEFVLGGVYISHGVEEHNCILLEKSVQIDPCRRKNVTLFVEIRLTLGDEIKMTPAGILRRGFFLVLETQVLARRG